MKKIILLLLTVLTIQNVSYAAFPVTENNNSISIVTELPIEDGENAAKTSMILAGLAVLFSLLMFWAPGFGSLIPMFFAFVFYVAAFIYGFIGLKSKSNKWQAYIGLFAGLLVLLALLIATGSTGDPDLNPDL